MRWRTAITGCIGLGVLLGAAGSGAWAQSHIAPSPTVIELFTSEGCGSCPAADAFAGELAGRSDVLLLSFHVDYWDYRGWKDQFAQQAFAERQHAYARTLAQRYVYTPQMVLDGRMLEFGADRTAIQRMLGKIQQQEGKRLAVRQLGRGAAMAVLIENTVGIDIARDKPATVWLAIFDRLQSSKVTQGDNAGRTLPSYNVVRQWRPIGSFAGDAITIPVEFAVSKLEQGGAVIVQSAAGGPILAALPLEAD
jgi:hypothetical protein